MSLRGYGPRFAPTAYHWGPSIAHHNDFAPLFSLLDDLTGGEATRRQSKSKQSQERFFAPRFDLKEVKDAYILEGELPGVEQKDISIEFTDEHTLVVSGHVEVVREEGQPPKGFIEAPEEEEKQQIKDAPHKATVEDEGGASKDESTDMVKSSESQQKQEPEHTYWVSERTSGSFTRSFSFPARVDQDGVKASLKNGILKVTVPKAPAPESRKINIE